MTSEPATFHEWVYTLSPLELDVVRAELRSARGQLSRSEEAPDPEVVRKAARVVDEMLLLAIGASWWADVKSRVN